MYALQATRDFAPHLLDQLPADESALVVELLARGDCAAMICTDTGGAKLIGYAVIGCDAQEIVTVYAARAIEGVIAKAAFKAVFQAAQIVDRPVRVHTEKVRAMASMMGANLAFATKDVDGVPMGVFANVE